MIKYIAALIILFLNITSVCAQSFGGWTPFLANALSTTIKSVKTVPGQFGTLQCYNPNASAIYVQVFNALSGSITLGTTVPLLSIPISATSTGGWALSNTGVNFSVAISISATTTATGSSAPTVPLDCNVLLN